MRLAHRISTRIAEALPGGRRALTLDAPLASLTFDDFPRSAWTRGGPILEAAGVRASFYPAGGLCGRVAEGGEQFTASDLREVRDAGHEIGSHGFAHRPLASLSRAAAAADLERNTQFLLTEAGVAPRTFAYPFGWYSPATLAEVRSRFAAARGVHGDINAGSLDPSRLSAYPLEARSWSAEALEEVAARAAAARGWLVLFTHDVAESPSPYGCTPDMLRHALEALRRAGVVMLPVAEALEAAAPPLGASPSPSRRRS